MGVALSQCGFRMEHFSLGAVADVDSQELMLEVLSTAADQSQGARPSRLKEAQMLQVISLKSPSGLEPLGFRYRDEVRSLWPDEYRFQASKRAWQVHLAQADRPEGFVLQMASRNQERTADAVALDMEDSLKVSSYAHRFNLYSREHAREAGFVDHIPKIEVAAPVACRVVKTYLPALLPVGAVCMLFPYADKEVKKFVFDGTEDFLELSQAFFHHAAFSSGGKELLCDLQGVEEEDGSLLLIDPCILRGNKVTVGNLLKGAVREDNYGEAACLGPVVSPALQKFDVLHPKCAPLCKAFDPHRSSANREQLEKHCRPYLDKALNFKAELMAKVPKYTDVVKE